MINNLKRKFILLASVSMLLLMTVLLLIMNLVNYSAVVSESDATLDVLAQPNVPFFDGEPEEPPEAPPQEQTMAFLPPWMSPEVPYESRFFTATVTAEGELLESDLSRIISVDAASAREYIAQALAGGDDRGFVGQFRYARTQDGANTRILFLDCGRKLASFRSFLWTSVGVGLFGCLVVFAAFLLGAGKIVAPIAESYEKQKRFISDAGHEIKTPLTIINANVDLLEVEGEQEELTEIRAQTKRLTELTNELVLLSKMEESQKTLVKLEVPLSDLVSETAASFRAPAAARKLGFTTRIASDLTANAAPDAIRQLVSILLDNAVKYAPEGGAVTLELTPRRKDAVLTVFNTTKEQVREEELPRVFDRFYRSDESRNSETGGHGIGLSVAKAITEAHGGSIVAETRSGHDFCVTVTLPVG